MKEIRKHIDSLTRRAAKEAGFAAEGDSRRELASHLFDLATNRASGRSVTIEDVDAAWAELRPKAVYLLREDSPEIRSSPPTASWIRRFAAYVVDVVALVAAAAAIIVPMNFIPVVLSEAGIVLFAGTLFAGLVFGLTAFEVRRGATPGKLLFRVRTVNANGQTPSWMRAWIISLPKVFPPLLAADVVLGLIGNVSDRRRLTERIVKLSVIRVT